MEIKKYIKGVDIKLILIAELGVVIGLLLREIAILKSIV